MDDVDLIASGGKTATWLSDSTFVTVNALTPTTNDLAERVLLSLKATGFTQSVVFTGLSASGKTTQSNQLTTQLVSLSTPSSAATKIGAQLTAIATIIEAFSSAKTLLNPLASRATTLKEIHFNSNAQLIGGKVLCFGLDRTRVRKLEREERTYSIFYELLAGANDEERSALHLLDGFTDYDLFVSSGCYQLPSSPSYNHNDSENFDKVRNAFKTLSFKPRHISSIYRLLSAILLLGNITFANGGDRDFASDSAYVVNRDVLVRIAELLGIDSEDLEKALCNQVRWIRKEICQVILRSEQAEKQRDGLMESLYAILFAFVMETANHKLFPGDEVIAEEQAKGGSSVLVLDGPGFQSRRTQRPGSNVLVHPQGNGYEEFMINYSNELVQFWLTEQAFSTSSTSSATTSSASLLFITRAMEDGIRFGVGANADPGLEQGIERMELLRGGRIGGKADRRPGGIFGGISKTCGAVRKGLTSEEGDRDLVRGMNEHFGQHPAFITSSSSTSTNFTIAHFSTPPTTYSVTNFIAQDLSPLDPEFVDLFRSSEDNFIAKLFAGPGLAAETHPHDESVIVAAQISAVPLRTTGPISPTDFVKEEDARRVRENGPSAGGATNWTERLLDPLEIHSLSTQFNSTLSQILNLVERTQLWQVICLRANDTAHAGFTDKKRLREQVETYNLAELSAKKKEEFLHAFEFVKFMDRYKVDRGFGGGVGNGGGAEDGMAIEKHLRSLGIRIALGESTVGRRFVWVGYAAFKKLEDQLPSLQSQANQVPRPSSRMSLADSFQHRPPLLGPEFNSYSRSRSDFGGGELSYGDLGSPIAFGDRQRESSVDDLLLRGSRATYDEESGQNSPTSPNPFFSPEQGGRRGETPYRSSRLGIPAPYMSASATESDVWDSDKPPAQSHPNAYNSHTKELDLEAAAVLATEGKGGVQEVEKKGMHVENIPASRGRRFWVFIVWTCTWMIPTFALTYVGRMKRPDVRMAWREKVTLCMLIGLFCGIVIFYIVVFGKLICPGYDNANNSNEVGFHAGPNDYWVSVRGNVYDLTNFYKLQHSDIVSMPVVTDDMLQLGGKDLTPYFPIPLTLACPTLVSDPTLALRYMNFTAEVVNAVHVSGSQQPDTGSVLRSPDWYTARFLPRMRPYRRGPLVWDPRAIAAAANADGRKWAIYNNGVYDLTDYFNTINLLPTFAAYAFLDRTLSDLWQQQPGQDITETVARLNMDPAVFAVNLQCIQNLFYVGEPDFRLTPKCQVQPYLLLTFSIILVTTILAKFLAALQLGTKKSPELRDKFVICQVPCYTEGEESLKKTIDSLATLTYDDKRKLLLIICDGMIIGSGNDRPTPRIVLDIFGVDQTVDPDPLMFKSVGEGSKQLNYGKVWSGLYEVDGHVVPYVVVAKCGRPSERSRPGNRGKRDSQILAMRFLNRVHFDSGMYPLELEMYHQIKNVIGVDPQLYEYMLVIDADTSVAADSLNRLVSCAADDSRIIGICGETKLENEQASWWTMIQVYEYFISHHMSKAFESLFGSVTCLPGCFTMYRIRSADKGKPLLVSSLIIDEYSDCNLDTLHKKNLLSLGEDRYLTTLILKHFPNYKTKFTPDAQAMTVAPDRWNILLSQRRRWINSTVHNLAELMFLPDMCGFCCFGMRFIVVIDLVGTLILPATFVYLVYLIVTVSTGTGAIPLISLIMLAAVYGFQAIIFLLKRQWQFIGWLVIYILAYPIYSFILPLYSFWCFDDFTWGSTRIVVGEGKSKKVISNDEEVFDESVIPMKKFSDYQAAMLEEDDNTSVRSLESRHTQSTAGFSLATRLPAGSYHGGADYYRDTNQSRMGSRSSTMNFPPAPSFGPMGFATGTHTQPAASVRGGGSEFGYMGNNNQSRNSFGPGQLSQPPSMANLMNTRNSMMSFGGGQPSPMGLPRRESNMSFGQGFPPSQSFMGEQRMSSYGSGNPFMTASPTTATISTSTSPTDEELIATLKTYLAHQDLMTVTKRTARDGLQGLYPSADLGPRKDFINSSIDGVLQGRL